ncbi:transcriptional regulator with XRE-family HTH domain [Aquimarina sp. EL_43]|uniref:helix-turn-helix domain-containing protein n=1 Tax=Aquimarina TaxID=290174 RepID=UPI0004671AAD|nr:MULTISPECIES: helix-turn-helix transcriptional regulator [Aquimarina]MBG6131552.1 transcriptional regulator with XRE-family HTH domain [Aquimarina sp. EL_35]MBG6152012.1 transcriptional regulator with XRE-family HTH domain [Aquimarina sp. EL_32]MBG6170044.1 transcriptional regulator with XRE-family HTH domain [Aquimarina sp. EL_43]
MEEYDKKELLNILAKRVKELRSKKDVTQEDALNDTGIHFGRIEQGKRDISFSTLFKICQYFEISPKDFFTKDFD